MSSPPASPQDDNELLVFLGMPEWIEHFLETTFFSKCSTHHVKRNELNRYCTTCNASACTHCIENGGHNKHQILTIYKHVYQEVVPLNQMEEHMDCSKIQTYKCNKKWVISLKPLPHKGSGSRIEGDGACIICKRKLTERNGRFFFCSIACKLYIVHRRIHVIKTRRARLAKRAKPAVDQQASTSCSAFQAIPAVDQQVSTSISASQAMPAANQQASTSCNASDQARRAAADQQALAPQTGRKRSRKGVPQRASTKV